MEKAQNQAAEGAKSSVRKRTAAFTFLFLNDGNLKKCNMEEDAVIDQIMKQSASHKVFVKWTDAYLVNEHNLPKCDMALSGTPGTSIIKNYPSTNVEQLQYLVASATEEEGFSGIDTAKRVFEELISSDQDPRVNLIVLTKGPSGLSIAKNLFAIIDESLHTKSYCVWGGETLGITNAEYKEDGKLDCEKPIFIGIRILNSSMKSWSLIVNVCQLEEKLVEFKKHVQLKRCSVGFVSGLSTVIRQELFWGASSLEVGATRIVTSSEIMALIVASFPNTIFYGGFQSGLCFKYGFNSLEGDAGIVTSKQAVSLMIVTHD